MPNHVTNRLTIFGSDEEINKVKNFIKSEQIKEDEKIRRLQTIDFNKITPMPPWVFDGNLGREEEEKYGRENCWYGWSIINCGTKWNAYGQPDDRSSENILFFQTAWDSPTDLIRKLSWIFPNMEFEIAWADENVGYNTGILRYRDGETIFLYIPIEGSIEAKKLFFNITQESLEDYNMDENYRYIDEEIEITTSQFISLIEFYEPKKMKSLIEFY